MEPSERHGSDTLFAPDPAVSIILVTWNVRELTLQCLESLVREAATTPIEVLVVDNASTDGTVEAITARFPEVRVLANRENVGFPRANNQGLREARGRYILFLNPDTVVGPGTIQRCIAELDRDATIGMVGCRLEYPDGRVQYEGARNPYLLRHLLGEVLYLHMLCPSHPVFGHHLMGDWDHRDTRDVEAICGAFMMVRRSLALSLGGLPEDVFMYHEDLSFCLRVRRAGYRIRYLGDVVTVHFANQSSRKSRSRLELLEGEVKLRLIREAQGPIAAAVGRAVFGVRSLLRLALAGGAALIPGFAAIKERYPRVFDVKLHWLHLVWTVRPGRVIPGSSALAPPAQRPAAGGAC